jgi:hypothetical protein
MKQSDSITELAVALVAVQGELRGVAKDSNNPEFRSSYVSLDAIIAASRPVLTKHGLAVVQGATTPHTDESGQVAAVAVETMLVHTSGQWLTSTVIMPVVGRTLKGGGKAPVDPQSGGSALTYGRRYGLSALLCLSTDEDDDANQASRAPKAAKPKATAVTGTGAPATNLGGPVMPFGDHKGEPLNTLDVATLTKALEWCKAKDAVKFASLITSLETELDGRNG